MDKLFTIGFTQKRAENFFEALNQNHVETVIDIRLNNTSQLAGFTKYPDIEYFLKKLCNIKYIHDKQFSPEEDTLKRYKKQIIDWEQYVKEFTVTMRNRDIKKYIADKYSGFNNICLLCSEPTAERCHRTLIADIFKNIFDEMIIINL